MAGSSKTWEHAFSCAFRQWRAASHCRLLHGYGLTVTLWFTADTLDECGWVQDFGGLKSLKSEIEGYFDHKTVVAHDDPHLAWFEEGERLGTLELVKVNRTGCESFAQLIFELTNDWLRRNPNQLRVQIKRVMVAEHAANAAYFPDCP